MLEYEATLPAICPTHPQADPFCYLNQYREVKTTQQVLAVELNAGLHNRPLQKCGRFFSEQ